MNVTKQYFRYVSQNIFGLIGTSCYILADTYFIAQARRHRRCGDAQSLPANFFFFLFFTFWLHDRRETMPSLSILRRRTMSGAHRWRTNGLMCAILIAVPFMLIGAFCPDAVLRLMGGDAAIVALGLQYTRIFLLFTPFFMCNYIVSAFTRNDGDPSLAMVATLSGSLFNVVFDYIFIFPMGWGLPGAALATAISPVISISVCSLHFRKPTNGVQFVRQRPAARLLLQSCQLGVSGFVGEMSSAVTTTVFNLLLLRLAGNVAVAALACGSKLYVTQRQPSSAQRLPGRAAAGEPVLRQARPGWCQEAAGPGQRHAAGAGSGSVSGRVRLYGCAGGHLQQRELRPDGPVCFYRNAHLFYRLPVCRF